MNQNKLEAAETSAHIMITAHAEFLDDALRELKRLDHTLHTVKILAPDLALCSVSDALTFMRNVSTAQPILVRHIAPVQTSIHLTNTEEDLTQFAISLAQLPAFTMLERGQHFSVQTRLVQTTEDGKRPYSSGKINQLLAEAIAEETGAVEDIKKPQIVVTLLCTQEDAYMGISLANHNLSAWPGGMRHFAQTPEQISRAEFKLLEALETFGVTLPTRGRALDLGAAPGGWTRLLLAAGLQVIAVDPAKLDPRLLNQQRLTHYRGYAEAYIEEIEHQPQLFDIITSDMRMDARDTARLLIQTRNNLRRDGFIISTLKLPHATTSIDPMRNLREALSLLNHSFDLVQGRQLFHNRQEVTIIAARPRSR